MKPMTESKTLMDSVYHWEKNTPDKLFLTQPMGGGDENIKTWTWKEAVTESRRMAAYLKSLKLPKQSHIAICSKNCAYWIMADLAIWMAGHISIPIFPTLTAETFQYTLEHSETKLLFMGKLDPVWEEMKKGVAPDLPIIAFPLARLNHFQKWDDIVATHEPMPETVKRAPEEMATIMYTSGSTGKPKGVMLSFGIMYNSVEGMSEGIQTNNRDRVLSYLPLAHGFERVMVESASFYIGFSVYFAESIDTFIKDLQRTRPTLFISVPRLWLKFQLGVFEKLPPKKLQRLLKIPILNRIVKKKVLAQLGLDHVRLAGSGSAPIPKEVISWYRNLGLELLEGYGMTENFGYSHLSKPGEVRAGYVGSPYKDVEHRISEEGEILVKSPGNMMGYYKMPQETREIFTEDGFLKTGDLGEIDDKNRLKITGRAKELFKTSKGKYIAPAPIENMLANHPCIEACCVTGPGHPQPYGVVMLSGESRKALDDGNGSRSVIESDLITLLNRVNESLPNYERLAFLAVTKDEWIPENGYLTPTLKIKRSKLEHTYSPLAQGWYEEGKPVVWQN